MTRIVPVTADKASEDQQTLLAAVQAQLGMVPNFFGVLAHSPAAMRAFLGLHEIAGDGALEPQTRERIALAVAEQNSCQYCVSAHTAIGRNAGLAPDEILANRKGVSEDAKASAALAFAKALVEQTGNVNDIEFAAVRAAGHSDAEIVEIITHVAMNIFTNLLGKAARIEIDFPEIELGVAA